MQLLTHVQATPDLDPDTALAGALTTALHGEVAAMNRENFIVRMHLEAVDSLPGAYDMGTTQRCGP